MTAPEPAAPMPMPMLAALARDTRGVAAVEFALVAPVFLVLMLGAFNVGQMVYGRSLLSGAVEKAARSAALETADTTAADEMVSETVRRILPGAELTSVRKSYFDFSDIDRPEKWNDADGDGDCNNGEKFTDENRNGEWDRDVGREGNGGANDVVLYTVSVEYTPAFVMPFAPDSWKRAKIKATAVRKNQPFAAQEKYATTAGICD
ncbi:TadE/TadG family type IV pilus assembly protein [Novosphingobium album (ex Liu et al. 2023)]|uniref:Pilus assembly protein n=1 Tax=Novosphingobium album (ex Liu et al. 2023) TaxID=3031130 RepID=A0ABT5WNI8_9SPHN|nr:TadE/TadG family type IV pilus assembly protein [Novosphingobium album (ex Liu et al. 2023)]MDE8651296.1 pilus assembly protein [Novosphingobium album (ex Liu et al. 2023)]